MTPTQFTAFANPLPDILCLIDVTGQILAVNPAAARFFALDSHTLSSKNLFDLVADQKDKLERTLRTWSSSRDVTPGVLQVRIGTGDIIRCHGYGNIIQPRKDDTPALIMLRIVRREKFTQSFTALNEKIALLQQEIMERRKTENALAYSKIQFEAVFNAIPDAVIFADTERRMVMNNPAVHTLFGYSDDELLGHTTEMLYADKRSFAEQGRRRFHTGPDTKTGAYEVQYRRKNGSTFWAETLGTQVNNREGEIIGFIGLLRDITERKRSEESIRNIATGVSAQTGEAFFQSLVKHLAKIFDIEYTFIGLLDEQKPDKVNTVALCVHGEVVDNQSYDLAHTPCDHVVGDCCSIKAYPDDIQRLFPDDPMLEEMGAHSYVGAPLLDTASKSIGLIVVMDNKPMESTEQVETILQIFAVRAAAELERLRTDKALRESQRMLELVLNSIPVRVFWKDRDSVYLGCNQHLAKDAGLESPEQIIGKTDFELGWREQAELYRADDQQVMQSGEPRLNYEEPQSTPDGGQIWLQTSKVPLRDLGGNIFGVMGVYGDITERKQAEDALRRSQKMDAIGQLSGGIAHDFNNQLGVIIGYLDFLKNHFSEGEKPRQWVDTATRATLRCMDLTRQLLAFSRRQSREKTVVDLNASIKEMATMIARSVTPEVEVEYSLAGDLWPTEIDPGELQDAILNLVINARDAMPYGGKLLIETTNKNLNAEYIALNPGLEVGDFVRLVLSDTGSGMDKKVLEHIFEPFFTTKPEGKGTGLGMAMVYGFAKRNRGHIRVYSEPDVGTTIRIYLPRATASKTVTPISNAKMTELPGGRESILIVDDEVDLLALADKYLSELGYHTRTAEHAAQALKILAGDKEFDLLFSDVVLPGGMNGYELAQQAAKLKPNLKVLLTSGYTSKTIAHNGLSRFANHLLNKPYRKDDLAQQIRLVLDQQMEQVENQVNAHSTKECLNGCTILVIDDEEDVRELFKLNLERLGCKVVQACNGDEAISIYQQSLQSNESIDAIILDLSIPGSMGGKEVADKIRSLDPHARIIVASGHTSGPEMTRYQDYGFNGALEKNFNREKIRQVLEQVLRPC